MGVIHPFQVLLSMIFVTRGVYLYHEVGALNLKIHKALNCMDDFRGFRRNMNTICVNGAYPHVSHKVKVLNPKLRTTVLT